ncbi:MAG: bacitracin resistance protein [Cryobacterium sp.]
MSDTADTADTAGTVEPPATEARRQAPFWVTAVIAVFFGLFFAYDLWEAVGNLVGVSIEAGELNTTLNVTGWVVLIGGVLIPIVAFGLAVALGRRRNIVEQVLLYGAGLCLVAVLSLNIFVMFGFGSLVV